MKKEDIKPGDFKRILIGDAPVQFLMETFLRTLFIYLIFLVVMRLMGKRMAGQLTITELGIVITLGAIIAPIMQLPDKGLFQGAFVLICVLFLHNAITRWGVKSQRVERMTQGKLSLLIKDGIIQLRELKATRIPKQQLFAAIRSREIYNLGEVERLYIEACGTFSLFPADKKKPGLPVLPSFEQIPLEPIVTNVDHGLNACCNCGNTQTIANQHMPCTVCHETSWVTAVV